MMTSLPKLLRRLVLAVAACTAFASCSFDYNCYAEFETGRKLPVKQLEEGLGKIARDFHLHGSSRVSLQGEPYYFCDYIQQHPYFDTRINDYRKDLVGLEILGQPESGKITVKMKRVLQKTYVMELVNERVSQLLDRLAGRGKWWKREFRKLDTRFDLASAGQAVPPCAIS